MKNRKDILLIDDNPETCTEIIDSLKERYNVIVLMSLTSANRILNIRPFDLAIIDVMMQTGISAGINEFQTGLMFYDSYIKTKYPDMPIIFLSYLSESEVHRNAKTILGDSADKLHYCNKFADSDLLNKVDNILNQ